MYLFTDEVKIFDMNLSSVGVMTVGIQLKEMDIALIEAWSSGLTLTGGILCHLNQDRDLAISCNITNNLTVVNSSEFWLSRFCTDTDQKSWLTLTGIMERMCLIIKCLCMFVGRLPQQLIIICC